MMLVHVHHHSKYVSERLNLFASKSFVVPSLFFLKASNTILTFCKSYFLSHPRFPATLSHFPTSVSFCFSYCGKNIRQKWLTGDLIWLVVPTYTVYYGRKFVTMGTKGNWSLCVHWSVSLNNINQWKPGTRYQGKTRKMRGPEATAGCFLPVRFLSLKGPRSCLSPTLSHPLSSSECWD